MLLDRFRRIGSNFFMFLEPGRFDDATTFSCSCLRLLPSRPRIHLSGKPSQLNFSVGFLFAWIAKRSRVASDFERIIFCFCYRTSLFVTQSINFALPNTIPLEKRGIYPQSSRFNAHVLDLSIKHISEPTRLLSIGVYGVGV